MSPEQERVRLRGGERDTIIAEAVFYIDNIIYANFPKHGEDVDLARGATTTVSSDTPLTPVADLDSYRNRKSAAWAEMPPALLEKTEE